MTAPLRLGLVGAGRWGRNYLHTVAGIEGVALTRVSTRNPGISSLVPQACVTVATWREVVDPRWVDAVIVASPPASHAEIVRAALEAGMPVLVEKPLTLDLAGAESLQALARARAGLVMVDHTHLFHPAFRALKEAARRYGSIRAVRSAAGNFGPFRPDTPVLWDWGPHDVAMCIDLFGQAPVGVAAGVAQRRRTPQGEGEIIDLWLEFTGAIPARIRIGNIMPRQRMFAVLLDRGALVYDDLAAGKLVFLAGANDLDDFPRAGGEPVAFDDEPPLACAVREFARAATEHRPAAGSLDLAVDVVRVLAAAQKCCISRPDPSRDHPRG